MTRDDVCVYRRRVPDGLDARHLRDGQWVRVLGVWRPIGPSGPWVGVQDAASGEAEVYLTLEGNLEEVKR